MPRHPRTQTAQDDRTPLVLAVARGRSLCVEALLDNGAVATDMDMQARLIGGSALCDLIFGALAASVTAIAVL